MKMTRWIAIIWLARLTPCIEMESVREYKQSCSILIYPGEYVRMTANAIINLSCDFSSYEIDHQNSMLKGFWFWENGQKMVQPDKTANTIVKTLKNIDAKVNNTYSCNTTQPENQVSLKEVLVGDPPGPVHNFTCISEDYENWNCSFMSFERVPVEYFVTYTVANRIYNCPCINESANNFDCECSLKRNTYRKYRVLLKSKNCFGELEETFTFKIANQVVPGGLEVQMKNVSSTSAILEIVVLTVNAGLYEHGFILYIKYRSEAKNTWRQLKRIHMDKPHSEIPLKDLFPHANYSVEIKVKSNKAKIGPKMWKYADVKFQTMSQQPLNAPTTDPGGFLIDNNKCVHIFWKAFPGYMLNGTDFKYLVSVENKDNAYRDRTFSNTSKYFYKHNICEAGRFDFTVQAENSEGASRNGNVVRVVVPNDYRIHGLPYPNNIISVRNDTSYNLKWSAPEYPNTLHLIDYTILLCATNESTMSFETCRDSIEFIHVPAAQTEASFSRDEPARLVFALSANYKEGSSGMTISNCPVPVHENAALQRLQPKDDTITESSITLKWTLTCVESALVKGYTLKYCAIDAHTNSCIHSEQIIRNISNDQTEYTLSNLIPFTWYNLSIKIVSRLNEGPFSLPTVVQTAQGAPSPPLNLKICSVRDDGAMVEWEKPEFPNGIIKFYYIIINGSRTGQVEWATTDWNQSFYIRDLESFEKYTIQVKAANVWNSLHLVGEPSNMVTFWTKGTNFQNILSPHVETEGEEFSVSWNSPIDNYTTKDITYELKWSCNENWAYYTLKNETKYSIRCMEIAKIQIFIRAVVDNTWQETFYCLNKRRSVPSIDDEVSSKSSALADENWLLIYDYRRSPHTTFTWYENTLIFLLCAIILCIVCAKIYEKHEKMKSLTLVVPPGLDDIIEVSKSSVDLERTSRSMDQKSVDNTFHSEKSNDAKESKSMIKESGYIRMGAKLKRSTMVTNTIDTVGIQTSTD